MIWHKFKNNCLFTELIILCLKYDKEQVEEIIRRDPLSEISEQEKELLWRLR